MKVAKADELLPRMPECYRLYDALCEPENWQDLQRGAPMAAKALGERLYPRLAVMPDLPADADAIVKKRTGGKGLWANLLGGPKPAATPEDEFAVRAKLIAALQAEKSGDKKPAAGATPGAAEPSDRGEPSWAALARLIREVSFLQSWEQMRTHYGNDEFLAQIAPLVADHPYAALINSHVSNEAQRKAALEELTQVDTVGEGLELRRASFGERVCRVRRRRLAQARQPVVRQDRARPLRSGADDQELQQ